MNNSNKDLRQNEVQSNETNTTLSKILAKGDFSLLTSSDFIAVGDMPPTEEMSVYVENNAQDISSSNESESPFQQSGKIQSHNVEPPLLGKNYEFKESIGSGGFCIIHKAYDTILQRYVAIKTLREEHNTKHSKRNEFITEAKVTAILDHPNIIPIHGLYTDEKKQLHLVIKLIDGKNLREVLQLQSKAYQSMSHEQVVREERSNLVSRIEIFLKVCDAIAYAHDKKKLHRDLKPENIMIGLFNEVYVMDWGIAESRETKTRAKKKAVQGTPQYLAPEIFTNHSYDSRSDIYSLGVLLFNLVYLKKPFVDCKETNELFKLKLNGQTIPMKHCFGVKISRALNYIVRKAMAVQPAARYQTVQALADDLHRFLRGDPVVESILGQIRKFFSVFFRN